MQPTPQGMTCHLTHNLELNNWWACFLEDSAHHKLFGFIQAPDEQPVLASFEEESKYFSLDPRLSGLRKAVEDVTKLTCEFVRDQTDLSETLPHLAELKSYSKEDMCRAHLTVERVERILGNISKEC